jgi:hypothetical protein
MIDKMCHKEFMPPTSTICMREVIKYEFECISQSRIIFYVDA